MKKIKNEVYRDSSKIVDRIEDILLIFEDENQAKILKVHPWILRDKNNKPKKKGIIVDVDILEPQNINWDERQKIHLQICRFCNKEPYYNLLLPQYQKMNSKSIVKIHFLI